MKKIRNKSGFTLIELLIVMVIIAILATLGIVAYTDALRNARNSRRISHLNSMQAAFEQFYSTNGAYAAFATMDTALQGGVVPTAPTPGVGYTYQQTGATTDYCICATLEGGTVRGGNASNGDACPSPTYTSNGSGAFYCVQNKQ
jgi:prepilin-type N-terminal cleavage/methylation domain-containing protein